MYQINNEKFGQFLSEIRKEKSMTQKELADQLFVSDKTVSKWERGNSMPNVALLIPIADVFGITVTELLKGERNEDHSLNMDGADDTFDLSVHNMIRQRKKKWILALVLSIGIVIVEAIYMKASGITIEQMGDSLYLSFLMLIFAVCCISVKEVLPAYYDKNKINFVSQGVFRIHMPGLAFHNGNWIHVLTVFRVFTLGVAILAPVFCYLCIVIGGVDLWNHIKYVSILILLAGLMAATYVVGKKYE